MDFSEIFCNEKHRVRKKPWDALELPKFLRGNGRPRDGWLRFPFGAELDELTPETLKMWRWLGRDPIPNISASSSSVELHLIDVPILRMPWIFPRRSRSCDA